MSIFLGWMPDAATQAALVDLQQGIRATLPAEAPRHDWRTPAQWHMTLRYLGEAIDEAQRARIDAAMAHVAATTHAPEALIVGAQYWPHARVLVAKIEASDALKHLLMQLEGTMQGCGFAKERTQTAHVTLAYLSHRDAPAQPTPLATPMPMWIDHVQLLRTVPGGYMSLATWPLARSATDA